MRSRTLCPTVSGPILAAALALSAFGCDLAEFEPIVEADLLQSPKPAALTLSGDATRLWAANYVPEDGQPDLRAFDTETGEMLVQRALGVDIGPGFEIISLAGETEPGHEQDVWVLHQNGYQTRWDPSLMSLNDWVSPLSGVGLPCDIARTPDGVTYITSMNITAPAPPAEPGYVSISGWTYYLNKRSANGQWTTIEVITDTGNAQCPSVAYDQPLDRVAVLAHTYSRIRVYSPSLSFISETNFNGLGGGARDLATVNSVFAIAVEGSSSGSITVIGPDGEVMDEVPMDQARAVHMQVEEGDLFHVWWTGRDILDEYAAGSVLLTGK